MLKGMRMTSDNTPVTKGNGWKELMSLLTLLIILLTKAISFRRAKNRGWGGQHLAPCVSKLIASGSAVLAGTTCKHGPCFWDTHRRVLGALAPSSVRWRLDSSSAVQVHFLISSPCSLLGKDQLCHILK